MVCERQQHEGNEEAVRDINSKHMTSVIWFII